MPPSRLRGNPSATRWELSIDCQRPCGDNRSWIRPMHTGLPETGESMYSADQEEIWPEQRFAVTGDAQRISVFRATRRRLRCEVSTDGVTWNTLALRGVKEGELWPVCGAADARSADLFCTDQKGAVIPVMAREGGIRLGASFRPVASAPHWYEAPPEPHDQVIVRDTRSKIYRAFFCARRNAGRHPERRGCVGVATSQDLRDWNPEPPVFAPNRYPRLFSPHVVDEGGHTVLFYATRETGNVRALRFAIAPSLEGPYERPESDLLACDVRPVMQTARLGPRRLVFFGRAVPGETPSGPLSRPGQIEFHPDGRPFVRFCDLLLRLMGRTLFETEAALSSGEILVRMLPYQGADFRLSARVRSLGAGSVALLFRATLAGRDNMTLWLEFGTGAMTLRRGVKGRLLARARRTLLPGTTYRLSLWAEGGFVDVYLDDEWVLTGPTQVRRAGSFGLAVAGGEARFDDVSAQTIETSQRAV